MRCLEERDNGGMKRQIVVNIFGSETTIDYDDGDDGSAGDREPLQPSPEDDSAAAEQKTSEP
jgi:hypothetical protein